MGVSQCSKRRDWGRKAHVSVHLIRWVPILLAETLVLAFVEFERWQEGTFAEGLGFLLIRPMNLGQVALLSQPCAGRLCFLNQVA